MKYSTLIHYKGTKIFNTFNTRIPISLVERGLGLIRFTDLSLNDSMLFLNCNSIHLFFMKMPIDVIFLNKEYKIIFIAENIKPFSKPLIHIKTKHIIEAKTGFIHKNKIHLNEYIIRKEA